MNRFLSLLFVLCFMLFAYGVYSANVNEIDYLVLVNKQHKLPDDWEEKVILDPAIDAWGDEVLVEHKALQAYNALKDALLIEGIDIQLDSIYRSVAYQEELYARFEKEYGKEYAATYVATPGFSEHHTGLAIDICIRKDGELIYENDAMIEEKAIFSRIHDRLHEYGFILRYMEGKEDITGYGYEPWHLRYIDNVEIATKIYQEGIVLEEYLAETVN